MVETPDSSGFLRWYALLMVVYRVLGPLEAERDGEVVEIAGHRQRALLAILLLHANRFVPVDTIVDELWGESAPPTAVKALHNAVSQLRKLLGPATIETRDGGYLLRVEDHALDAVEFESLCATARHADALALWRGSPYPDLRDYAFAQGELRRLDELRLAAIEEQIERRLAGGEDAALVAELETLVASHPFRERLREQLMLALYRSGRQAEALDAYHASRRLLIDELGIEPSRALQDLHCAILRQEGMPAASAGGAEPVEAAVRALLAGELVPVLGPDVSARPRTSEIADRLAEMYDCPLAIRGSLARVSEYVALTEGVEALHDELHAMLDCAPEPGPVHAWLAQLPPFLRDHGARQPLIVTTSYDDALEEAFRAAGEPFDTVAYVARGPKRGRFAHTPAEGPPRIIDTPNVDTSIDTDVRPVILKIYGCVDRRPAREWESFVVSEDDYIDYLANVQAAVAVPVTLAARLRRGHFLFLAYGVADWNLRVFLRRLWGDERMEYRSWAVQPQPMRLERDFWRHRNVEVVDRSVDEYVEDLTRRAEMREPVAT